MTVRKVRRNSIMYPYCTYHPSITCHETSNRDTQLWPHASLAPSSRFITLRRKSLLKPLANGHNMTPSTIEVGHALSTYMEEIRRQEISEHRALALALEKCLADKVSEEIEDKPTKTGVSSLGEQTLPQQSPTSPKTTGVSNDPDLNSD
jgi:hypothetical protein